LRPEEAPGRFACRLGDRDLAQLPEPAALAFADEDPMALRKRGTLLRGSWRLRGGAGTVRIASRRGRLRPRQQARHRARQALGLDGLDQVVERIDLEGAQRVLVIGRREDNKGHGIEGGEQVESRLAWHLHVEEQKLWLEVLERSAGLEGVRGLSDHLDLGMPAQETAELVASKALVVHDQRLHGVRGPVAGPAAAGGATWAEGMTTSQL